MTSLNLHIYPSALVNESRLLRLTRSLQETELTHETHIVGVAGHQQPSRENPFKHVFLVRINAGPSVKSIPIRFLKALLSVAFWNRAVFRAYSRRSCAVIAAHSVWVLPLAYALAIRTGAVLAYNPHEYESGTPTMKGIKKLAARVIERFLVPKVDVFSCVNDSIADLYLDQLNVRPLVVRNLPSRFDKDRGVNLRELTRVNNGERLFVHSGNLTSGRSIPLLLEVFSRRPEIGHLVFLGDGPLRSLVDASRVESRNIHHVAPVSPNQIVDTLRSADVGLCLIDTSSPSYSRSSPNKLFEGLAAGIPVLCSGLREAKMALGASNHHWVLQDPVHDIEGFLVDLTDEAIDRFEKTYVPLPDWEDEVGPLLEAYMGMVEQSRRNVSESTNNGR